VRAFGAHWTLSLPNPDADGFFDEMAFWNPRHGILVGDQVQARGEKSADGSRIAADDIVPIVAEVALAPPRNGVAIMAAPRPCSSAIVR